jgi:hypothetical protein
LVVEELVARQVLQLLFLPLFELLALLSFAFLVMVSQWCLVNLKKNINFDFDVYLDGLRSEHNQSMRRLQ